MARVINAAFGIGIAVLIFIVILLGIQAIYKEPNIENFNCTYPFAIPAYAYDISSCNENISVKECNALIKEKRNDSEKMQAGYDKCLKEFQDAEKIYGRNVFLIANIAGIIAVIASLFLLSMINIAAGTAFSGIALIFYGFARGWQGTDDILKFIIALIVAIIFIILAVFANKKYGKIKKKK
ncbi:hypothetical protein HYT26_03805 [Candidatus Pacearchaeota archaeon]|nr:hypothetical protein [Candidatus Pacearchaeota archaeon]